MQPRKWSPAARHADARPGELDTISYRGPLLAELIAASVETEIVPTEAELVASLPIEATVVIAGSQTMSAASRAIALASSGALPLPARFFPPSPPPASSSSSSCSGSSVSERSSATMAPVAYAVPSDVVDAEPPRESGRSRFAFTLAITGLALVFGAVIGVGLSHVREANAAQAGQTASPRSASRTLVTERTPLAGTTREKAARPAPRLWTRRNLLRGGAAAEGADKPPPATIELGSGAGSSGATAAALLGSSDSN